jgi:aminoglycoside/choline kinase family phosphotransferase
MSANAIPPQPEPVHELDFAPLLGLVGQAFDGQRPTACEPMPGGASTRRYFRIRLPRATAVAMFVPDGSKPEEVARAGTAVSRWPFLEVRDLLAARGVDVPLVYGEETARGWVLLEDLGDDTLATFLAARPDRRAPLYVRAVTDLARAQGALAELPAGCVVAGRAFDEELLSWEIHHFREWALEARGVVLSADDRATFTGVAERLARRIAAWPRAFVHRDYQSRNLMVRTTRSWSGASGENGGAVDGQGGGGGEATTNGVDAEEALCWIDFQDALLGPRVYDLVALLNDSYQVFDRAFVEARLDDYARAHGWDTAERAAIGREFDLVTVQRKLKDAGRFVFIDRVKHNPRFLEFVEPTIAKVRASLARLGDDEDMRALAGLLARVLP